MLQISQRQLLLKWFVIFLDLISLNLELGVVHLYSYYFSADPVSYFNESLLCWNFSYLLTVFLYEPIVYKRNTRAEQVVSRSFSTVVIFLLFYYLSGQFLQITFWGFGIVLFLFTLTFLVLVSSRLFVRFIIKVLRRVGQDNRRVVLVGSTSNIVELYNGMIDDVSTGYRVIGYFDDVESANYSSNLPYLGTVSDVISYLDSHEVDQLYCALPSVRATEIRQIIYYCENHLVRFYSVPNVRNYVKRQMMMEMVNDIPVLSIRVEPLRFPVNRLVKRAFDIFFSSAFLFTLFPLVLIVVSILIKKSSPGPVFFKQKRNGLNGKEFLCLKFRSMHVNDDADVLQATENDPRKFPFGDFMRRTNIDELPQFINVFLGNMSVVGPRPHMLKHTEEYSALINRYMVRHLAKPGITGWAQVKGCRGETRELYQMEERVKKDIWYVENWSFWLDLRIIYLTVRNMLHHDDNAY